MNIFGGILFFFFILDYSHHIVTITTGFWVEWLLENFAFLSAFDIDLRKNANSFISHLWIIRFLTLLDLCQMNVIHHRLFTYEIKLELDGNAICGMRKENKFLITLQQCNTMRCETKECDHFAFRYTTLALRPPFFSPQSFLYKITNTPALSIQSRHRIAANDFKLSTRENGKQYQRFESTIFQPR